MENFGNFPRMWSRQSGVVGGCREGRHNNGLVPEMNCWLGSFGEGLGWLTFGADTGVLGRFNPQLQAAKLLTLTSVSNSVSKSESESDSDSNSDY